MEATAMSQASGVPAPADPAQGDTDGRPTPVPTPGPGRASWTGFLELGPIVTPVKAYPLIAERDGVELHQVHAACGRRIQVQKCCPDHGPVAGEAVAKAYEYAPGRHVVLDEGDLRRLAPAADQT